QVIALEPSAVITVDYEKALELTVIHADLRKRWLQSFARTLQKHFFGATGPKGAQLLVFAHVSQSTRALARQLIERLRSFGEEICVLSDSEEWRTIPGLTFCSLLDGGTRMETDAARRQIAEWQHARRIIVDAGPQEAEERVLKMLEAANRV